MYRFILLLIICLNGLLAQNVLILNSYRQTFQWTYMETKGVLDTLKKSNQNIHYYIEDMDTKVFRPTPQREKNLLNYYENKYTGIKFDAIIITDDNAINFVRKYKQHKIFKDAKVFFGGVNNLKLKDSLDKNIYAGVFETKEPLANLNIARKIVTNLKTIYIIGDNSVSANKVLQYYESKFTNTKDIKFVYLNNKNFEFIEQSLQNYDSNSAMMALTYGSMFENGEKISAFDVLYKLSKIYHNPIIVHGSPFVYVNNSNVIGGNCSDAFSQGSIATTKMLEYFNGKAMRDIGFELKKGNKIYINVRNLSNFGYDVDDLNLKNPILVNNNFTFWEKYKIYIVGFLFLATISFVFFIIIARKNTKLNEVAEIFHQLFENSLELNLLSYKGVITDINRYGLDHLGYKSKQEIIGKNIFEFIKKEDHQKVLLALHKEKSGPYELNILQANGTYRTFLNTSINVRKDDKIMRLSTLTDISKIKQKDKLLFEQSKLASMGEMIGNIAHQWRQPLSVISTGATGILVKLEYNMPLDDKYLIDTCKAINTNAQYLSKTIDDFRNFIKANKKKDHFSIAHMIDSLLELVKASAKMHEINIITNITDISLDGYENELLQCCINIFNNSKDILQNLQQDRLFFIDTIIKENKIQIIFVDNAGGIPKDIIDRIFEPYFTTKHQSQGTGLGLYMARKIIIDDIKGDIKASNTTYTWEEKQYTGAKFVITIPLES